MLEPSDIDLLRQGDFPHLRNVAWYGESVPLQVLRHWIPRLRHVSFTRLYGAAEASIASCYVRISRAPETDVTPLPIGRPREGEEALVLDERLQLAPVKQVGEVHIRGRGLSPGYWRNADDTAAQFPKLPSAAGPNARVFRTGDLGWVDLDGQMYPAGRRDRRASHDVELGEIEAALRRIGSVRAAAVVAVRADDSEGLVLGCAYVPVPGIEVTAAALRADLSSVLPSNLLPSRWRAWTELPRVADGTIDSDEIRRSFTSLPDARVTPVI